MNFPLHDDKLTEYPSPEAQSFWLCPSDNPMAEAEAFLRLMAQETVLPDINARLAEMRRQFGETGTWEQNEAEISFGARVAWRNSIRCIGRMFWPSLRVFDCRALHRLDDMYEALCAHINWANNGGDLRPALSLFRPGAPDLRILNAQMILYAGYQREDGSVLGDPKNISLTRLAVEHGWRGAGTEFDLLPLMLFSQAEGIRLYDLPRDLVLEVPLRHPEYAKFKDLGLRWFALPAVSGMALDMGGIQYQAAPSSGVYQGTEIGSFNLADPRRYNKLAQVAACLGLDTGRHNPLWRDQAMIELNRAVLYSFAEDGMRIMDHHSLSESFDKFCQREDRAGRQVHGHWPWLVPPLSSNLCPLWHRADLRKTIQKPGYFYQPLPERLPE